MVARPLILMAMAAVQGTQVDVNRQVKALDASAFPSKINNRVYPVYEGPKTNFRFATLPAARLNATLPTMNRESMESFFSDAAHIVSEHPMLLKTLENMQQSNHGLQRELIQLTQALNNEKAASKKTIIDMGARESILQEALQKSISRGKRLEEQNARLMKTLARIGDIERSAIGEPTGHATHQPEPIKVTVVDHDA
ncbi:hypothetical protein AAMO2058_000358100 [Amorphochlora amoebiformis]